MIYYRDCPQCGDHREVHKVNAGLHLCLSCAGRRKWRSLKGDCEIDGKPLHDHPQCSICGILTGIAHIFQGDCPDCVAIKKQRQEAR